MLSKKFIPAFAMLILTIVFGGCIKEPEQNTLANSQPALNNKTISATSVHITTLLTPVLQPVILGTSANYVLLSKAGITDVFPSVITGNVASSPITGAAILLSCTEVTGAIYTVDATGPLPCRLKDAARLTTAITDLQTAYTDAATRLNPTWVNLGAGTIGTPANNTLTAGLYKWGTSLQIYNNVTLAGSATDVWIFQIAGTFQMASGVKIILSGGALAKNVFWQVADAVTIGTTSHIEGTILGKTSVSLNTKASITGRILAQTAITLQMNTVTANAQ